MPDVPPKTSTSVASTAVTSSKSRLTDGRSTPRSICETALAEIPSRQVTLERWLSLHPGSLVMQPDPALRDRYEDGFDYETGASRRRLTGTDTSSWSDKSWVVGITVRGESRAYDWNRLRRERVADPHDELFDRAALTSDAHRRARGGDERLERATLRQITERLRPVPDALEEVADESRLAGAPRPEHREQPPARRVDERTQRCELPLTADERVQLDHGGTMRHRFHPSSDTCP